MNINEVQENNYSQNEAKTSMREMFSQKQLPSFKNVQEVSFQLEIPEDNQIDEAKITDKNTIDEILNFFDDDINELDEKDDILNSTDAQNIKCLQNLAMMDNIPILKRGDIEKINLKIITRELTALQNELTLNVDKLNVDDISFIKILAKNPEVLINSINSQNSEINFSIPEKSTSEISYKTLEFSKGLYALVEKAYQTQKPIRLDFGENSSVILRIDNKGKLAAQFLSSDAAMEQILKNSIPNLRSKLDSEGIPYKEISYKENNKKENNKNKGGRKDA